MQAKTAIIGAIFILAVSVPTRAGAGDGTDPVDKGYYEFSGGRMMTVIRRAPAPRVRPTAPARTRSGAPR